MNFQYHGYRAEATQNLKHCESFVVIQMTGFILGQLKYWETLSLIKKMDTQCK